MKTKGTVNCVRCLNKANLHAGHVKLYNEGVLAGWCEIECHSNSYKEGQSDENGCYGAWKDEYGLKDIKF